MRKAMESIHTPMPAMSGLASTGGFLAEQFATVSAQSRSFHPIVEVGPKFFLRGIRRRIQSEKRYDADEVGVLAIY